MTFIPVFLVFLLGQFGGSQTWVVWRPWLAAAVFTVLAATDAVDGYVARTRNEVTTFGKFIDPLADKLLVTAALVGLVQLGTLPGWVAIVMFILKGARAFPPQWVVLLNWASWVVMGVALILTIVSAAEYFYHARDIIAGPWCCLLYTSDAADDL